MQQAKVVDQPAAFVMPWRELGALLVIGAIVGLLTYALYGAFNQYVFTPALCGDGAANIGRCENKDILSAGFGTVLAGLLGLFLAVRQRVYRPLLVVIMATIALWNVVLLLEPLPWFGGIMLIAFLGAVAYAAFAWLAQVRNFVISLLLMIALVVAVRLLLA